MRVVVSAVPAVKHVLLNAWSTCMLTFATSDSIYCLYPYSFLEKNEVLLLKIGTQRELVEFDMCMQKGMKRVLLEQALSYDEFRNGRYIGDQYTLRVSLNGEVPLVDDLVRVSFSVGEHGLVCDDSGVANLMEGSPVDYFPDDCPGSVI